MRRCNAGNLLALNSTERPPGCCGSTQPPPYGGWREWLFAYSILLSQLPLPGGARWQSCRLVWLVVLRAAARSSAVRVSPNQMCLRSCGLAGLWFPLAISKGRGGWLAAAAGESGSRGAARRGHLSNAPLPPLPGGAAGDVNRLPPWRLNVQT
jgi:hypothetical protein